MKFCLKGCYYSLWSKLVTARVHDGLMQDFNKNFQINADACVLDIGCATGYYRKFFTEQQYFGVDPAIDYLQLAEKSPESYFSCQSAEQLAFKNGSFDLIISTNVIHHLPDGVLRGMLQETERLLKPGGRLVIYDVYRAEGQSFLLKLLYDMDFGKHVRQLEDLKKIYQSWKPELHFHYLKSGIYPYYCLSFTKVS